MEVWGNNLYLYYLSAVVAYKLHGNERAADDEDDAHTYCHVKDRLILAVVGVGLADVCARSVSDERERFTGTIVTEDHPEIVVHCRLNKLYKKAKVLF